jgi:hypothetical protein
MPQALTRHPDFPCDTITHIAVDIARPTPTTLHLTYSLAGDIPALAIPATTTPARADDLWRHTCFEAFLRAPNTDAYLEFNFAPSTRWAAYRFSGYREGMAPAETTPPRIAVKPAADVFQLTVAVDLPNDGPWRLGLSAVIEEASGRKSYWALAHPDGKPDFHHAAGLAYDLIP